MSIQAINWALEQPGTPTQKHVLLVLANYANESGISFPSVSTLAADTGLSERAIKKARSDLLAAGLVKKSPKYGRSCFQLCLTLQADEGAHRAPKRAPDAPHSARRAPKRKGAPAAPESAPRAPQSAPGAPPYNHQLTTIEPKEIPPISPTPKKSVSQFALPDWVPVDAWEGWLEMRRSKKCPATKRALELSVRKLDQLRNAGHSPGDVLDQSTLKGWQGLFPLKGSDQLKAAPQRRPLSQADQNRLAILEHAKAKLAAKGASGVVFQ